jgi:hypothetical protein
VFSHENSTFSSYKLSHMHGNVCYIMVYKFKCNIHLTRNMKREDYGGLRARPPLEN